MKWYNVDKKEPTEFDTKLLFSEGKGDWECGYLRNVISSSEGKQIVFSQGEKNFDGYKYWAKPEPPNE